MINIECLDDETRDEAANSQMDENRTKHSTTRKHSPEGHRKVYRKHSERCLKSEIHLKVEDKNKQQIIRRKSDSQLGFREGKKVESMNGPKKASSTERVVEAEKDTRRRRKSSERSPEPVPNEINAFSFNHSPASSSFGLSKKESQLERQTTEADRVFPDKKRNFPGTSDKGKQKTGNQNNHHKDRYKSETHMSPRNPQRSPEKTSPVSSLPTLSIPSNTLTLGVVDLAMNRRKSETPAYNPNSTSSEHVPLLRRKSDAPAAFLMNDKGLSSETVDSMVIFQKEATSSMSESLNRLAIGKLLYFYVGYV